MRFEDFEKKYLPYAKELAFHSQDPEVPHQICKLAHSRLSAKQQKDHKAASAMVHKVYFSQFYYEYELRTETIARHLYPNLSIGIHQEWKSVDDCLNMLFDVLKDFPPHLRVIFAYNLLAEQGKRNMIPGRLLNTVIEKNLEAIKTTKNGKDMDYLYHEFINQLSTKILAIDQNKEWFSKLIHYDRGVEDRIETWKFLYENANVVPKETRFARSKAPKRDMSARIRYIWDGNKDKIMLKLSYNDFFETKREVKNE